VIAELNNADDNECRHSWSEQEIHSASFLKSGYVTKLNSYDLVA